MRAVVFDFFGTLTDPGRERSRRDVYDATAATLGVTPDRFWQEVSSTFTQRATGVFGDTRSTLRTIAQRCGARPSEDQLAHAVTAHHEGARLLHSPRPGALATLAELKARGFRLALLSDCSSELCELWDVSPYAEHFDATVFSWSVGFRKPDPRGFAKAAESLTVRAAECWFVGDGGSRELGGALAAGMRPVWITNAAYGQHAQYRDDPDAYVPADVVADIGDVLPLLGDPF